eukprot:g6077.t1
MTECKDAEIEDPCFKPITEEERKCMDKLKAGVVERNSKWERYVEDETRLVMYVRGYPFKCWKDKPLEESMPLTVNMLCDACEWWDEMGVDTILDEELKREEEFHEVWSAGISGQDKRGRTVYVMHPFSQRLIDNFSPEEIKKLHQKDMTSLQTHKRKIREERKDPFLYQHIFILDCYGQKSVSIGKARFIKALNNRKGFSIDQYYYPESLYKSYVVNTPMIFRAVWKVAQNFIHPLTRAKIKIRGSVFLQDMLDDGIPLESIPRYMGGKAENPKGFMYHDCANASGKFLAQYRVSAGEKVRWSCFGRDIVKIQVHFVSCSTETTRLQELTRYKKQERCVGEFTPKEDGEFIITFDNTAAWVKAVYVAHSVKQDGKQLDPMNNLRRSSSGHLQSC